MANSETISVKVSEFIVLNGTKKPNAQQRDDYSRLRGELAALGLDPQHINGLAYRALVYDNKTMIENYLKLVDSKKDTKGTGKRLKALHIDISNTKQLRNILAGFKTAAKDADRQKNRQHIKPGRKAREDYDAEFRAEMIAEDQENAEKEAEGIETLAKLCEEAEAAKAKRDQLSSESFQAWVADAAASAAAAIATT